MFNRIAGAAFCACLYLCAVQCFAQTPAAAGADTGAKSCFISGLQCGVLFGPNFNIGADKVAAASVVNGVIRVSNDQNVTLNSMLDVAYFFPSWHNVVVPGFFVAGGAASNSGTAGAFAFGGIFQFPHNALNTYPIDLALGVSIVPNTQVLGDGDVANRAPPQGETAVRFKSTTTFGIFLGAGIGFNIGG